MKAVKPSIEENQNWLFAHSNIGIIILDREYSIVSANDVFYELVGCSSNEIIGKAFSQIVHDTFVLPKEKSIDKKFSYPDPFAQGPQKLGTTGGRWHC